MSSKKLRLYFVVALSFFVCLKGNVSAQTVKHIGLTRDDVVLKRDKPTIYMCVDSKLTQDDRYAKEDSVWLRIYNNTIWLIKFNAERIGTSSKLITLANGYKVAALTDGSVSFPHYGLELKDAKGGLTRSLWGDMSTINWLPSNTSTIFKVPNKYFKEGNLYLEFNYEWEITGKIGTESYAPIHRVYFYLADPLNTSGSECD